VEVTADHPGFRARVIVGAAEGRTAAEPAGLVAEDKKARGLVPGTDTVGDGPRRRRRRWRRRSACAPVPGRHIDRLLLADGEPLAVHPGGCPPTCSRSGAVRASQLDQSRCTSGWKRPPAIRIALGEEYIEADSDTNLAELLLTSPVPPYGRPALLRAADRRPIEYVVNTYRADRYRFRVELVRP